MKVIHGRLPNGVTCRQFDVHCDSRGNFSEIWCEHWNLALGNIAQLSLVYSNPGVLRGMYLHREHDEFISLVKGRAIVGLKDLRETSGSHGVACLIEIEADRPGCVCFPRGILHGWLFITDSIHLQAVSESYREYAAHDNLGCRWDDPQLNLPWPERPRVVSKRSSELGSLRQLQTEISRLESLHPVLNRENENPSVPDRQPISLDLAAFATSAKQKDQAFTQPLNKALPFDASRRSAG